MRSVPIQAEKVPKSLRSAAPLLLLSLLVLLSLVLVPRAGNSFLVILEVVSLHRST